MAPFGGCLCIGCLEKRLGQPTCLPHGLGDRVSFKEARAKDIKESDFDLVTCFDCLHDMGDPRGCSGHMHRILKADGTWMIVEPIAGNRPEDNMNPVGRLYYNASTMICVPTSLDQEVGEGLGAQAGETKLTEVIRDGGLTRVRRATAGPSLWSRRRRVRPPYQSSAPPCRLSAGSARLPPRQDRCSCRCRRRRRRDR